MISFLNIIGHRASQRNVSNLERVQYCTTYTCKYMGGKFNITIHCPNSWVIMERNNCIACFSSYLRAPPPTKKKKNNKNNNPWSEMRFRLLRRQITMSGHSAQWVTLSICYESNKSIRYTSLILYLANTHKSLIFGRSRRATWRTKSWPKGWIKFTFRARAWLRRGYKHTKLAKQITRLVNWSSCESPFSGSVKYHIYVSYLNPNDLQKALFQKKEFLRLEPSSQSSQSWTGTIRNTDCCQSYNLLRNLYSFREITFQPR